MNRTIREIEPHKTYLILHFEDGFRARLPRECFTEREDLTPGGEVDWEEFTQWLMPRQYTEALHYAVSLLSQQGRCSGEIQRKLKDRFVLDETAEMVIYKLQKERLLDDGAYARHYAEVRSRMGMGRSRIRMELSQKGLDHELIAEALEAIDTGEAESTAEAYALKLLNRYAKEPDPRKATQKLLAAMARHGYSLSDSRRALEGAKARLRGEQEESDEGEE